jgi:hypothetical protein
MRIKSVTFTHPTTVFGNQSVAFLSVEANDITRKVDAIEARDGWVLVTIGDETRGVAASKVEHAVFFGGEVKKGKAA